MTLVSRIVTYVAILLLCVALYMTYQKTLLMQEKISIIENNLELAIKSKDLSDQAVDSAIRTREQLHEHAKQQMRDTEQALKDSGSWCDIAVPDNVRRMFEKHNDK
jgi:predicted Holliday junction resolvase-like endonuclease